MEGETAGQLWDSYTRGKEGVNVNIIAAAAIVDDCFRQTTEEKWDENGPARVDNLRSPPDGEVRLVVGNAIHLKLIGTISGVPSMSKGFAGRGRYDEVR